MKTTALALWVYGRDISKEGVEKLLWTQVDGDVLWKDRAASG